MSEQRRARRISEQIDRLRDQLESSGRPVRRDKHSILLAAADWIDEMIETGPTSRGTSAVSSSAAVPDFTPQRNEDLDYHHVFVHSGAAQSVAAIDGTFLDCNRLFTALLGFSPTEVRSQSVFTLTPAEEFRHMFSLMGDMMQSKSPMPAAASDSGLPMGNLDSLIPAAADWNGSAESVQFQKLCRTKCGTLLDVIVHMALVRDRTGEPLYFTCTVLPVESPHQKDLLAEYERNGGLILHTSESSKPAVAQPVCRGFCPPDLPHLSSVTAGAAPLAAAAATTAAPQDPPPSMEASATDRRSTAVTTRHPGAEHNAVPPSWHPHHQFHAGPPSSSLSLPEAVPYDPWGMRHTGGVAAGYPHGSMDHGAVSPQAHVPSMIHPVRNGNENGSHPHPGLHPTTHQHMELVGPSTRAAPAGEHVGTAPVHPHLYHTRGVSVRAGMVPVNRGIGIHPPQVHHSSVEPPAGTFLADRGMGGVAGITGGNMGGMMHEQYYPEAAGLAMGRVANSDLGGGGSSSGSMGRTGFWEQPAVRRAETDSSSNRSIRRASKLDILLGEGARSLTSDIPRSIAYDPTEGEGGRSFVSIGTIPDLRNTLSGLQQLSERDPEQQHSQGELEPDSRPGDPVS